MASIAFDNLTRANVLLTSKAKQLSGLHESVPIEELLTKDVLFHEFKADQIQEYLNLLTPENAYYIVKTKENATLPDLKTEYYYGTLYASARLDAAYLSKLA
jgi:secreted Zn-dependent insulinase-like peptidase